MKTYTNFPLLSNTDEIPKHNCNRYNVKTNVWLLKSNLDTRVLDICEITSSSIISEKDNVVGLVTYFGNAITTFLSEISSIKFCDNFENKIFAESKMGVYDTSLLNTNNLSLEGFLNIKSKF